MSVVLPARAEYHQPLHQNQVIFRVAVTHLTVCLLPHGTPFRTAYMELPFNYTLRVSTRNHDMKRGFSGPQYNGFEVFALRPNYAFCTWCLK